MKIPGREKTVWAGEYKGVSWEINRFPGFKYESMRSNEWCWTFYLHLCIDRIPVDAESYWLSPRNSDRGRIHYDYNFHPVLSSISWHGGATWYSKEGGHDGSPRVVQVGCDFQHSWDHERGDYELDEVYYEVKEAIDSFRALVPGYKYWCRWDGGIHDPSAVVVKEDGSYSCGCTENNRTSERVKAEV